MEITLLVKDPDDDPFTCRGINKEDAKLIHCINLEELYEVPMDYEREVIKWFCEEPHNAPFPRNTLLHYSYKTRG